MNETQKRTAAATAGRMRKSEERMAAKLDGRGWVSYPPEMAEWVRSLVEKAMA